MIRPWPTGGYCAKRKKKPFVQVIVKSPRLDLLSPICIHAPVQVATQSKALARGRSLAGTVGSNLSGGMNVCLF